MLSMIIALNAHTQLIWEFLIVFFGGLASIGIIWFICAVFVRYSLSGIKTIKHGKNVNGI